MARKRNKIKNKKAQAAMEFLMTYGWAVLILLAAIGALAYFGVFKYNRILPEHCILSVGISCEDYVVYNSSAVFLIRNGIGNDITVNQLIMGDCAQNFSARVVDGGTVLLNLTGCDNGNEDEALKKDLELIYTDSQGFEKRVGGRVVAIIQ